MFCKLPEMISILSRHFKLSPGGVVHGHVEGGDDLVARLV